MVSLYSEKQSNIKKRKKSLPGDLLSAIINKKIKQSNLVNRKETPQCTRLSGVLTVEAAIIMPLTAAFFVGILFFFRIMLVQMEIQKALSDTGRQLAIYLASEDEEEITAGSFIAAQVLFRKELASRNIVNTFVKGGIMGVSLANSELQGDEIFLAAGYSIKIPVSLPGVTKLSFVQTVNCRKWSGWKGIEEDAQTDVWVYITETGTVYHTSAACTHLTLSIRSVTYEEMQALRNENGTKYRECELCAEETNKWGRVYITNQGDCYHYNLGCSGIKRTVSMIRLSEVENRPRCSKCGKQE